MRAGLKSEQSMRYLPATLTSVTVALARATGTVTVTAADLNASMNVALTLQAHAPLQLMGGLRQVGSDQSIALSRNEVPHGQAARRHSSRST